MMHGKKERGIYETRYARIGRVEFTNKSEEVFQRIKSSGKFINCETVCVDTKRDKY